MEFRSYFEHVKSLGFDDRPDYDYLKRLFRDLFFRKGYTYDNLYDWDLLPKNNFNNIALPPDPHNVPLGEQEGRGGTGGGGGMVGVLEDDNVDMRDRDRDRRTLLQPPMEYDERLMYPSNKVSVGGSQLLNQNSSSLLPRESTMENAGLGKYLSF